MSAIPQTESTRSSRLGKWRALLSPVWFYSGLSMAGQGVQMVCSLVVLRWVAPEQMGLWLSWQLVESYAQVVRLGVINSMNRQYPFLLGQGKEAEAINLVRVGWAHASACAGILGAGFMVAAFWSGGQPAAGHAWVLVCYGVFAVANMLRAFLEATYRGGRDFAMLAKVSWIGIMLQVASLPLVAVYGFEGFYVRAAALAVVTAFLCYWWRPVRQSMLWDRSIWLNLVNTGWPLFLSNYVTAFGSNLPRLILVSYGSVAALGLFAPLAGMLAISTAISGSLLVYFVPGQNFQFGRDGDANSVVRSYWRASLQVTCALLPVSLVGWLLIPSLVEKYLPGYMAAVEGMRWAAISAGLLGLKIAISAFHTLQAWRPMYIFIVIQTTLLGLLPWAAITLFSGDMLARLMQGVVAAQLLATAIGYFCLQRAQRLPKS